MALGAAWPAGRHRKPAGRATNLATEAVVRAPPDGYTLLLVAPANAINATLYDKLNFNFVRDIVPVAGIIRFPNVVVVNPSLPIKTIPELIAYAKANPGKLNMASSGNGSTIHMSGELFKMLTGINMVHVPYRGGAPALTDLIAGQVHVMFDNIPTSAEHVKAGRLRGLAVTSAARSEVLPDLPTVADVLPGYEASAWYGLGVPKNTPRRGHRQDQQGDERGSRGSQGRRRGSRSLALRCYRARPPTSAGSSPMKPRSGARWSGSRAPSRTRAYTNYARQNVAWGNRHARAYRNANVDRTRCSIRTRCQTIRSSTNHRCRPSGSAAGAAGKMHTAALATASLGPDTMGGKRIHTAVQSAVDWGGRHVVFEQLRVFELVGALFLQRRPRDFRVHDKVGAFAGGIEHERTGRIRAAVAHRRHSGDRTRPPWVRDASPRSDRCRS